MNPVLVELPNEVHKIQAFREGVNHPGWHAPVTLILDNSFVVINSETGSLLRTFPLPADRSKIVECKYIANEKYFLVATDDAYLIIVPENSKGSAEYFQQKWPVKIKEIVILNETSVAIVSDNDLACVRLEHNRISVPNYVGSKATKKSSSLPNSPPYLKKVFSSCGKLLRITAQSKSGVHWTLWEEPLSVGDSAALLTKEVASSHRHIDEIHLENEDIYSILVDPYKQCCHVIVHDKLLDTNKKGKHAANEKSSRWLKFDLSGNLLFERKLKFIPAFACLSSDRLWLLTDGQELTSWSARYGTLLQTITITAPIITQLCDLVHQDSDQGNYSLLYGLKNRDGEATTIFRYDVGGVSTAPVSLAALVGNQNKRSRDAFMFSSSSSSVSSAITSHITSPLSSNLYFEVLRGELDSESIADSFSQDKQKRRKISQLLPVTSSQVHNILHSYNQETSDITNETWIELLMLVRAGVFSVQSHRNIWQAAIAQARFDVLSEMIRFAVDISEFQVIDILQLVLDINEEALQTFSVLGGNLVFSSTKESVLQLLTKEESSRLLPSAVSKPISEKEHDKKKSKKRDQATVEVDADSHRLQLVRAIIESILYRVPRFSPTIVSEAMQRMSASSATLVLRMIVYAVRDITAIVGPSTHHIYPYLGTPQLLAAIEWMEAIVDSHFSSFLFEADASYDTKRCLQALIRLVQNADGAIEIIEETRGLWADIERSLTRQGMQPRADPGLYTVEILRL